MKKVMMLLLGLTGLLVACGNDANTVTLEQFCERNPGSVQCGNDEVKEVETATELFEEVFVGLSDEPTPEFCEDYFSSSTLVETCTTDSTSLLPEDSGISFSDLLLNDFTTEGIYKFVVQDPSDGKNYQFSIEVDDTNGYTQINNWDYELLEDPIPVELTIENAYTRMQEMYDDYYANTLVCSDYFTNTNGLLNDCYNGTLTMFTETVVTDSVSHWYDATHQVFMLYHNYGGDAGYTMLYPQVEVYFVLVQGQIKLDQAIVFDIPTAADLIDLVDAFEYLLTNATTTDTEFCEVYDQDLSNCESWRSGVRGATVVEVELEVGDNGYGDLVFFLHVTADGTETVFELNITSTDNEYFEFEHLWVVQ